MKLVAFGLLLLAISACFWYRVIRSSSVQETRDAFIRAYEYRDAQALIYEPRWKDFEVARDYVLDDRLTQCGEMLQIYRHIRADEDRRIDASLTLETTKALKPVIEDMNRKADALVQQMQPCLK